MLNKSTNSWKTECYRTSQQPFSKYWKCETLPVSVSKRVRFIDKDGKDRSWCSKNAEAATAVTRAWPGVALLSRDSDIGIPGGIPLQLTKWKTDSKVRRLQSCELPNLTNASSLEVHIRLKSTVYLPTSVSFLSVWNDRAASCDGKLCSRIEHSKHGTGQVHENDRARLDKLLSVSWKENIIALLSRVSSMLAQLGSELGMLGPRGICSSFLNADLPVVFTTSSGSASRHSISRRMKRMAHRFVRGPGWWTVVKNIFSEGGGKTSYSSSLADVKQRLIRGDPNRECILSGRWVIR